MGLDCNTIKVSSIDHMFKTCLCEGTVHMHNQSAAPSTETPCLSSVLTYKLGMLNTLEACYVQNGTGLICTSLKL